MPNENEPASFTVLTGNQVRVSGDTVRIGAPTGHREHGDPTIQLVREDGVIRAIDVTCGCGDRFRIVLDYA